LAQPVVKIVSGIGGSEINETISGKVATKDERK